jgi:hypothetical protein
MLALVQPMILPIAVVVIPLARIMKMRGMSVADSFEL